MTDDVWTRAEIDSPCVKLCVIHPESRTCVGCWRTIDEISAWSRMSADQRHEIMQVLPSRASQLTKRRGGRMGRVQGI